MVDKGWLEWWPRNRDIWGMIIEFQSLQHATRQGGALFPDSNFRRVPFKSAKAKLRIFALFRAAHKFEVPIGYQDETGFHRGEMPRPE